MRILHAIRNAIRRLFAGPEPAPPVRWWSRRRRPKPGDRVEITFEFHDQHGRQRRGTRWVNLEEVVQGDTVGTPKFWR